MTNNKKCPQCGNIYPANKEFFHKHKGNKDGLSYKCKKCKRINNKQYYIDNTKHIKEQVVKWQKNNKDRLRELGRIGYIRNKRNRRNYDLKRYYGITLEGYDILFELQKGRCAICGIHQSKLSRRLDVDHNHKTNKIRDLLCSSCNNMIKKDNTLILLEGIKYLNKHGIR